MVAQASRSRSEFPQRMSLGKSEQQPRPVCERTLRKETRNIAAAAQPRAQVSVETARKVQHCVVAPSNTHPARRAIRVPLTVGGDSPNDVLVVRDSVADLEHVFRQSLHLAALEAPDVREGLGQCRLPQGLVVVPAGPHGSRPAKEPLPSSFTQNPKVRLATNVPCTTSADVPPSTSFRNRPCSHAVDIALVAPSSNRSGFRNQSTP